jgi:hypothetical protein
MAKRNLIIPPVNTLEGQRHIAAHARDIAVPNIALNKVEEQIYAALAGQLPSGQRTLPGVALMLAQAAKDTALIEQLDKVLAKEGQIVTATNGVLMAHPATKIKDQAAKRLATWLTKCSLQPSQEKSELVRHAREESMARGGRALALSPATPTGEEPDWVAMATALKKKGGK